MVYLRIFKRKQGEDLDEQLAQFFLVDDEYEDGRELSYDFFNTKQEQEGVPVLATDSSNWNILEEVIETTGAVNKYVPQFILKMDYEQFHGVITESTYEQVPFVEVVLTSDRIMAHYALFKDNDTSQVLLIAV